MGTASLGDVAGVPIGDVVLGTEVGIVLVGAVHILPSLVTHHVLLHGLVEEDFPRGVVEVLTK